VFQGSPLSTKLAGEPPDPVGQRGGTAVPVAAGPSTFPSGGDGCFRGPRQTTRGVSALREDRPWLQSYPTGVPHSLEPYPTISLFGMLEASGARFGNQPAIAWFGGRHTYRWLLREVERFSAVLVDLGVRAGARVVLILPNTPQYVIASYACARIGAIAVGNNPLYTEREMEHQLRDTEPAVVVILDEFHPAFAPLFVSLGIDTVLVTAPTDYMAFPRKQLAPLVRRRQARAAGKPWPPVARGARVRWWADLISRVRTIPPVREVDPLADAVAFLYTGGTTGPPKAAMLSHRNLVANALQTSLYLTMRPGAEVILCALPLFHAFGMLAMNVGISIGAKLALVPDPRDLRDVLRTIARERVSFFPGVPRMYVALNESPMTASFDLRSVRACVSGAAPLPKAVAERFAEITGGARVVEGYGMTETSPVTHGNPVDGRARFGTIGLPLPDTDCRIVDPDAPERDVAPGERGELCVRGPQVMLGYWRRPEETAAVIRDGWLHSGDIAVMERDGYFRIVDRLKDMIIVSGFKVFPTEVEAVLYRHPSISKVCVLGVPDGQTGEAVKAYVVLRAGESLTAEELHSWASDPRHGLSGYHVPKLIEFRESLPETTAGKVLRREVWTGQQEASGPPSGSPSGRGSLRVGALRP
jgi:long-chain acyl-CoA synthetase